MSHSAYLLTLVGVIALVQAWSPLPPSSHGAFYGMTPHHWPRKYDLNTNYYLESPDTSRVVEYTFEINHATIAPDGLPRDAILANGMFPGPTIEANWGDTIILHVINNMTDQGTGIHFHGIRQNQTNLMDGVPSITQCPIAPGDNFTYTWKATRYGSSWWHSHYELQQYDGLAGAIVIHGPASAPYDYDAGPFLLTDWGHNTTQSRFFTAESSKEPVKMENGLINGRNPFNNSSPYYETVVQAGKKYRLRIINTAINSVFKFSVDQHSLLVIAADLNPIKPYNASWVNVGIGERYDVVLEANQASGDFWIRSIPQARCSAIQTNSIRGILRYNASSKEDPKSTAYNIPMDCNDEQVVPYLELNVGQLSETSLTSWNSSLNNKKLIRWYLRGKDTIEVQWDDPTLLQISQNVSTWTSNEAVIPLQTRDEWVLLIIQSQDQIIHPMHLHGHDFYVLATSGPNTTYVDSMSANFKTINPPRRDSIMLPPGGYLAVAFLTDNPGAWLFHCHIGWHLSEGMALQFVERYDDIYGQIQPAAAKLQSQCQKWSGFQNATGLQIDDSGV